MKCLLLFLAFWGLSLCVRGEESQSPLVLRTDAAMTDSSLSDDAFLCQYAKVCHANVENFIAEEILSGEYVKEYGKREAEAHAAEYRNAVHALVSAAEVYYRAYMSYVTSCICSVNHPYELEMIDACRALVRRFMLCDRANLRLSYALWLPSEENSLDTPLLNESCSSSFKISSSPFEESLKFFMKDTHSSEYYTAVIVDMRYTRLEEMRRMMKEIMEDEYLNSEFLTGYYGKPSSPEQVQRFLSMEKAWDTYYKALCASHSPVSNSALTGTGTGGFILQLRKALLNTHMEMLVELIHLREKQFND